MKQAILIHGKPDKAEYFNPMLPSVSNANWFPWIQQQLNIAGIASQTPEMPNAWQPQYPTWAKELERYDITPETMLVGHSAGGGFLVRWLSEHPGIQVGKVVLVAPSMGLDWGETDFFAFEVDPNVASRTKGLVIFGSDNDRKAIRDVVGIYRTKIDGADYREIAGHKHFTYEDIGSGFPELLCELLADTPNPITS